MKKSWAARVHCIYAICQMQVQVQTVALMAAVSMGFAACGDVCTPVHHGDLRLRSDAKVEAQACVEQVLDGSILVERTEVTKVVLPSLRHVDGSFWFQQNARLEWVEAPLLESAYSLTVQINPRVRVVSVPALRTLADRLNLVDHAIEVLDMEALESVPWATFRDLALEDLALPALGDIDRLSLDMGREPFVGIELPQVETLQELHVGPNQGVVNLSWLSALTSVAGQVTLVGNACIPDAEIDRFLVQIGRTRDDLDTRILGNDVKCP